jgi:translation initiation factor 2B subunit (eIF-2B alpha/beta/delta family)
MTALRLSDVETQRWIDRLRPASDSSSVPDPTGPPGSAAIDADADLNHYKTRLRRALESLRRSAAEHHDVETHLFEIASRVVGVWRDAVPISYIPEHGPDHNVRMVEVLCEQFRAELRNLDVDDLRILLAAIWIHDLGLALPEPESPDSDRSETQEENPLIRYEKRSEHYLDSHSHELGLSYEPYRRIVSNLCRYHRNRESLEDLSIEGRQKALLALLRLANLMAVSADRVKGRDLVTFKEVPRDIAADTLRSLFVAQIDRDELNGMLLAKMVRDGEWGETKLKLLSAKIQQDLQSALDRIKTTLVIELKTNLLRCSVQTVAVPPDFDKDLLRKMLDMLGTASSPNAERVFDGMIASLTVHLAEGSRSTAADIRGELDYFTRLRPCHWQTQNLADRLGRLELGPTGTAAGDSAADLRTILDEAQTLKKHAHQVIGDSAPITFAAPAAFFVFGYSGCVLTALEALQASAPHRVSRIYVCECRNKSLYYDVGNSVEYSDGVEYARKIREMRWKDVRLISDVSICHAIRVSRSTFPSVYVLFGADGINPQGHVSGTIGTATIAAAAKHFGATVCVLAEGGKVRDSTEYAGSERPGEWLTADPRIMASLRNDEIRVERPLNEEVPVDLIDCFITERGVLTPAQFSETYGGIGRGGSLSATTRSKTASGVQTKRR